MDSGSRRPFNRSLCKEPGMKKPRLIEDPISPDRIANGRAATFHRPAVPNSGRGGGSRIQRDRDFEGSDPSHGDYQLQQLGQRELVTQYKTSLSELTFNSKPVITNLTIIAGEIIHAAKAIAAIICLNILEVPSDQKLPSLYLLDSIVKNIGRDYIKYFTSRLPEVFCKAYRQVDPSLHPSMRHLFGTWKGVFPPQALQIIEKELGFPTATNDSSAPSSKPKPQAQSQAQAQAQAQAHSIHVNPMYLESRQRQTTSARGAVIDNSEALVNSHRDVESLDTAPTVRLEKSWADPTGRLQKSWADTYAKPVRPHHPRDHQVHEAVHDKYSRMPYSGSDYDSTLTERAVEKAKEVAGYGKTHYTQIHDITGVVQRKNGFRPKHGFETHGACDPVVSVPIPQLKQKAVITSSNGTIGDWKDTEEEEFMWEEMNSTPIFRGSADDDLTKDLSTDYEKLDFDTRPQTSQNLHDNVSRDVDEASDVPRFLDPNQVIPEPGMIQARQARPRTHPGPLLPVSSHDQKSHLPNNFPEPNRASTALSVDRTRPSGYDKNTGPNTAHLRTLEVSGLEPCRTESRSSMVNQSPPLAVDSSGSSRFTPNPVSSLLTTLGSRGLIKSSKSGSPERPDEPVDRVSIATRSSPKPFMPKPDEPSGASPSRIKYLIDFEFRPDVIRNFNPGVIDELTDSPHRCTVCGLGLKLEQQLERHMDWHASRVPSSRSWYANTVEWVARFDPRVVIGCAEDAPEVDVGPTVPADEGQCACILCGELFVDFYSCERDGWMFGGAVWLMTDPSSDGGSLNHVVVHEHCVTENSLRDLGFTCDHE